MLSIMNIPILSKYTSKKIKNMWRDNELLKRLMNEKIQSSRKQEENNLVINQMLKSLEEAFQHLFND